MSRDGCRSQSRGTHTRRRGSREDVISPAVTLKSSVRSRLALDRPAEGGLAARVRPRGRPHPATAKSDPTSGMAHRSEVARPGRRTPAPRHAIASSRDGAVRDRARQASIAAIQLDRYPVNAGFLAAANPEPKTWFVHLIELRDTFVFSDQVGEYAQSLAQVDAGIGERSGIPTIPTISPTRKDAPVASRLSCLRRTRRLTDHASPAWYRTRAAVPRLVHAPS